MIDDLASEINRRSGEQVGLCYHCHKCTAGCPVLPAMDYGPDRLLRMVALNQVEEVLESSDIWLCAGCFTCAARCPNDIDIAAVMDALRQLAVAERYRVGEPDALLFHRLFLGVVKHLGRSHEAALLGLFKILSRIPILQDMDAGIRLFLRGKVPILPERTRGAGKVRALFNRSR
jgi:heterodisulfide reductase subunit C